MPLKLSKSGKLALRESDVARQIVDLLHSESWMVIRLQSGLFQRPGSKSRIRAGEPGLPDYVCFKGQSSGFHLWTYTFFLETKSVTGKLRPEQVAWHKSAEERGITVCVASDIDEFKNWYRARYAVPVVDLGSPTWSPRV